MKTLSIFFFLFLIWRLAPSQNLAVKYLPQIQGIDELIDLQFQDNDSLLILVKDIEGSFGYLWADSLGNFDTVVYWVDFDTVMYQGKPYYPGYQGENPVMDREGNIYNYTEVEDCPLWGATGSRSFILKWGNDGVLLDSAILECWERRWLCSSPKMKRTEDNQLIIQERNFFPDLSGSSFSHVIGVSYLMDQDLNVLTEFRIENSNLLGIADWTYSTTTLDSNLLTIGFATMEINQHQCDYYKAIRVRSGGEYWFEQWDDTLVYLPDYHPKNTRYFPSEIKNVKPGLFLGVRMVSTDTLKIWHFREELEDLTIKSIDLGPYKDPHTNLQQARVKRISGQTSLILTEGSGPNQDGFVGFLKSTCHGDLLQYDEYPLEPKINDFATRNDTMVYLWGNNSQGPFIAIFTRRDLAISGFGETETSPFSVFPNPTDGLLFIENQKAVSGYQLIDMMGRVKSKGILHSDKGFIQMDSEKSGAYILILEDEHGNSYPHRIIKI